MYQAPRTGTVLVDINQATPEALRRRKGSFHVFVCPLYVQAPARVATGKTGWPWWPTPPLSLSSSLCPRALPAVIKPIFRKSKHVQSQEVICSVLEQGPPWCGFSSPQPEAGSERRSSPGHSGGVNTAPPWGYRQREDHSPGDQETQTQADSETQRTEGLL